MADDALLNTRLSEAEVNAYRKDGIVIPKFRLPPELLTSMIDSYDRLLQEGSVPDQNQVRMPHVQLP